jgi:hypothetical protein
VVIFDSLEQHEVREPPQATNWKSRHTSFEVVLEFLGDGGVERIPTRRSLPTSHHDRILAPQAGGGAPVRRLRARLLRGTERLAVSFLLLGEELIQDRGGVFQEPSPELD